MGEKKRTSFRSVGYGSFCFVKSELSELNVQNTPSRKLLSLIWSSEFVILHPLHTQREIMQRSSGDILMFFPLFSPLAFLFYLQLLKRPTGWHYQKTFRDQGMALMLLSALVTHSPIYQTLKVRSYFCCVTVMSWFMICIMLTLNKSTPKITNTPWCSPASFKNPRCLRFVSHFFKLNTICPWTYVDCIFCSCLVWI